MDIGNEIRVIEVEVEEPSESQVVEIEPARLGERHEVE